MSRGKVIADAVREVMDHCNSTQGERKPGDIDHWKRSGEGGRWREKRKEEKRGKEKKWVR